MASRPMLYLIDGHALAYRQFFALPVASFTTRAGEPTNATFGFARTLLDILQKDRPKYLAIAFDMGLSGRDALYSEYKGTREKMPSELDRQITRIQQMVETFNIPVLAKEGYEADDVIGTVVPQAEAEDTDTRIITGDRDLLQLLTEHVTVQLPSSKGPDVLFDVAKFREEWGLEPGQLVDYKALVGDTSDNIPGVKGIGDKGATKLLQQYGSLDGLYAHIAEIKGATQQKLIEGKDSAYLSQNLAAIRRNVPVTLDLKSCIAHDFDVERVSELFREVEFRSLLDRLHKVAPQQLTLFSTPEDQAPAAPPVVPTITVQDEAGLADMVAALNAASAISFDTETTSTDQMAAELVGISLSTDGSAGYYIPVGHKSGVQLPMAAVLDAIRPPLTDPKIPKYGHNASYDLVVLQRYGVNVTPITFDTMIAEWVRDPVSKFLGLKNLARQELNVEMTEISELIGRGKKQITMDQVAVEQAAPYAAADAAITYRLVNFLRPELEKLSALAKPGEVPVLDLFNTLDMPFVPVVAALEQAGIVLDVSYLKLLGDQLAGQLAALELEIYALAGMSFNINSPKQLNTVLFDHLQLNTAGVRKTTHGLSTAADVLDDLKGAHPVVDKILQHREISKLKGTYVDALPALINPTTGRVHTSYNQAGSGTGRMSSSNPNLQNIPIRTELGRQVRRAILAPPGMLLLSVDYSQVELRILAHWTKEPTLLEAFRQNLDIHAATAAAVYGIPVEQVTFEQRNFAKRVNFGLLYGMGAFRLGRESGIPFSEAEAFVKTYFDRLPQIQKYHRDIKQQAHDEGYLTTLLGRRRSFPVLKNADEDSHQVSVRQAQREAINMPIQGTAADIIKKAMIELQGELKRQKLRGRMIMQVHDELVLEVPEREIGETSQLVVQVMEGAYKLDAPLRANAEVGANWEEMGKVGGK